MWPFVFQTGAASSILPGRAAKALHGLGDRRAQALLGATQRLAARHAQRGRRVQAADEHQRATRRVRHRRERGHGRAHHLLQVLQPEGGVRGRRRGQSGSRRAQR